jgi:hypothetical protein
VKRRGRFNKTLNKSMKTEKRKKKTGKQEEGIIHHSKTNHYMREWKISTKRKERI